MSVITCAKCGAKNRVEDKAGMQPKCGRCGALLATTPQGVVQVTDASFLQFINSADQPVLIDCWAPWCGPCRMLTPTIDQIADESHGKWRVGKLNVDDNPRVAQQFQISSIPTLLIFHHGQLADRLIGLQPKQAIVSRLNQFSPAQV